MADDSVAKAIEAAEADLADPAEDLNTEEVEEESTEEVEDAEEEDSEEEEDEGESEDAEVDIDPRLAKQEAKILQAKKEQKKWFEKEEQRLLGIAQQIEPVYKEFQEWQAIKQMAHVDPATVLKQLGIKDLAGVAKQIWSEELGDDAPAEWKSDAELVKLRREVAALQKPKEQEPDTSAQDEYVYQLQGTLEELPEGLDYLEQYLDEDPGGALEAMWDAADFYFKENSELGIPDPEDVAEFLNNALREDAEARLERAKKVADKKTKKTKTLSSKKAQGRPKKTKTEPKTEDEMLEAAVAAAKAEMTSRTSF